MKHTIARVGAAAFASLGLLSQATEPVAAPPLALEVRVEREGELTRIEVVLRNDTDEPFRFDTGARGGIPHLRTEPFRLDGLPIGSAPTVLPELWFEQDAGGVVHVTAPALGGPTRRAMNRVHFEVAPRSEAVYYRFLVPTVYAAGELAVATLQLEDVTLRWTRD